MKMRAIPLSLLLITTGCTMTPKLTRPAPPVAAVYPVAPSGGTLPEWRGMFGDPRLQRLIALALRENRDLRIAALNAEAARAQIRVQRAQWLPNVNLDGSFTRQRQPVNGIGSNNVNSGLAVSQFTTQLALTSFELDLFGRLRAQNAAATERYLSSWQGQRAVRVTVIGAVVEAYLAERLADEQMALTEATLVDWRTSLDITRKLKAAGQSGGVDLAQAQGLVQQAQADFAQRHREKMMANNALTLAVGTPIPEKNLPQPVALMDQPIRTALPSGTPSDLLEQRPDIAQAEHDLRAANADVGAARAAFFPRISLTGAFGFASAALGALFNAGNQSWSFAPAVSAPIFRGGELRGNLQLARIRTSIAVSTYEKTVQTAFREVADGLASRATYTTQLSEQRGVVQQAQKRATLAFLSYRAGMTGRLELLDAQRHAYAAQQALLEVRRDDLASATALYRALGGGVNDNADIP